MLNVVLHEVELVCTPDGIPASLTVDLAGLDIGDVVHVGAVSLPEGVELADADEAATVATHRGADVRKRWAEPAAAEGEEAAEKTA